MRLAIRFLGLDLLTVEASTDDDADYASPDLESEIVYSGPVAVGFSLPSTEYDGDDDDDAQS